VTGDGVSSAHTFRCFANVKDGNHHNHSIFPFDGHKYNLKMKKKKKKKILHQGGKRNSWNNIFLKKHLEMCIQLP
jgi:hypothetical protein